MQQIAIENNCHLALTARNKSKDGNHNDHPPRTQGNTINTGEENTQKWIIFTYTGKKTNT